MKLVNCSLLGGLGEENHKIAERRLLEARSENAKLKAEMHHGFIKDESREGRGLLTTRLNEEDQSRLKEDLKHEEKEVNRLRRARDEAYKWYLEAFGCYEEGIKEKEEIEEENAELKNRLSETASASSTSPTHATKVSRKEESQVNVPPWPKVNDLGLWKANLIQAIVIAAND